MAVARNRNILIIIDPQNDFCEPGGALYVPGAEKDMERLAEHLREHGREYSDIYISLDSHDNISIFHPKYWVNDAGDNPDPFTMITFADFMAGTWKPSSDPNKIFTKRTFDLMSRAGDNGMMIWPEHCVVSTHGYKICDVMMDALAAWRDDTGGSVRYIFKGESPYAEQFSIFDNIDGSWANSGMCEDMFARFALASDVTFAGEALSHCVEVSIGTYMKRTRANSVYADQRVHLLSDCTSPVTGYDREKSESRIAQMGVVLRTSQ